MFDNSYIIAEKLDKIADAIKEARKEGITVRDIYRLAQDKDSVLINKDGKYVFVEEDDFDIIVKFLNVEDYILIN